MNTPFATVEDISLLWRALTEAERTRAEALLPLVSDMLRQCADDVGKELDLMAADSEVYASTLKLVTVDIVTRVLRQNTTGDAMTQESQSALGYSWSGTYAVPGGGIAGAIMNNDLKRLGLLNQTIDSIMLWGRSDGNHEPKDETVGKKVNIIGIAIDEPDSNLIGRQGG